MGPSGRQMVVNSEDCCQWDGVVCDNVTAHVLELHLANPRPLLDDYGSDAENEARERSMGGYWFQGHGKSEVSTRIARQRSENREDI
ncbi:protein BRASSINOSTEROID INSENSITIVE 1-like [Gossypium australe]|uniref:Protein BRASSINOSTEROID INSENSITIVE 1-like n=1 Tax=Gossypium australe TaxID=47621 RepID=A0A5B6WGB6_9ROSI|nr:protein BRASSINOSTEROID INSENSITIVE 1-like [Gossypium australe]